MLVVQNAFEILTNAHTASWHRQRLFLTSCKPKATWIKSHSRLSVQLHHVELCWVQEIKPVQVHPSSMPSAGEHVKLFMWSGKTAVPHHFFPYKHTYARKHTLKLSPIEDTNSHAMFQFYTLIFWCVSLWFPLCKLVTIMAYCAMNQLKVDWKAVIKSMSGIYLYYEL